ncbi:GDSL esterase/lipase At5g33370 [Lactuca sativa]|uniref:GDSL esterase/lipase At5g33370 n=1 Tax=Lactuca sativa TaxID=4236 RepID=UPI000CD8488D|nr:GDSL esterase/lipase At5g33370 [Lactuca sativa]
MVIRLLFFVLFWVTAFGVAPEVSEPRPFFVFGDSLVDNGNNNYLFTGARADSPPYGIDTPLHLPTGRFSNGRTIPDILSEVIGSEPALPYLSPELTDKKLPLGANFASAGIGILNDTGMQFGNILRMPVQLEYFREYQRRLTSLVGQKQAKDIVNRALVLVSLGGNDFVNNYYLYPFSARSLQFTVPEYVIYLMSEYRKILMTMYNLGVRRAILMGSGPLGCAPGEIVQHSLDGECAPELQAAAQIFEPQLAQMVQNLNHELGADVFVAANTKLMHNDIITNPQAFGFETSKTACCGLGPYNGIPGSCNPSSNLCNNRDKFVFWDSFHPTERASRLIVEQMMNGTDEYMKPMNLTTIMYLDSHM